jgi:site-specific DNA-methyltransferase (adenine-specific)
MTPYYQDDLVTIYHGDCELDCRSVVAGPDAAVLVTDPPYGIDYESGWASHLPRHIARDMDTDARDDVLFAWGDRPALVFGSWKVQPPEGTRAALVWDKGLASGMGDLAMPWKPNWELIYVLGSGFSGRRDSGVISGIGYNVVTWATKGRTHPNEKPVALLRDLIGKCPAGTILDPFMGSGSTLVAAKEAGRRVIGIEIEERYCEVAAQRCSQEVLGLAL